MDLSALARGPEIKDHLLGTHSSFVTRHAGCSVLVAREQSWDAAEVGGTGHNRWG
jgi:hypothetical protein